MSVHPHRFCSPLNRHSDLKISSVLENVFVYLFHNFFPSVSFILFSGICIRSQKSDLMKWPHFLMFSLLFYLPSEDIFQCLLLSHLLILKTFSSISCAVFFFFSTFSVFLCALSSFSEALAFCFCVWFLRFLCPSCVLCFPWAPFSCWTPWFALVAFLKWLAVLGHSFTSKSEHAMGLLELNPLVKGPPPHPRTCWALHCCYDVTGRGVITWMWELREGIPGPNWVFFILTFKQVTHFQPWLHTHPLRYLVLPVPEPLENLQHKWVCSSSAPLLTGT